MKINNNMAVSGQINNSMTQANQKSETDFKAVLEKAVGEKDKEQLKEACRQFETMFIGMMYKQMKTSIPKSELLPTSFARETFESMLDDEFAEKASQGQGVGLADMLYKQLSKDMDSIYKSSNHTKGIDNDIGEEKDE